jgi:hypothetical protein
VNVENTGADVTRTDKKWCETEGRTGKPIAKAPLIFEVRIIGAAMK